MRIIGSKQMLSMLEAVVSDNPGFRYPKHEWPYAQTGGPNCLYERLDQMGPACLIGHVIDRIGLLHVVGENDLEGVQADAALPYLPGVHFTQGALVLAHSAQYHQDSGETWEEALRNAREDYEKTFKDKAYLDGPASADDHTPDTFVVRLTPESDWTLHTDGPADTPF